MVESSLDVRGFFFTGTYLEGEPEIVVFRREAKAPCLVVWFAPPHMRYKFQIQYVQSLLLGIFFGTYILHESISAFYANAAGGLTSESPAVLGLDHIAMEELRSCNQIHWSNTTCSHGHVCVFPGCAFKKRQCHCHLLAQRAWSKSQEECYQCQRRRIPIGGCASTLYISAASPCDL